MKRRSLIFVCLVAASCATTPAGPKLETISFKSKPEGGLVTITDPDDTVYSETCFTPCELTLDVNRSLDLKAVLDGYETTTSENFLYIDPRLEEYRRALYGRNYTKGARTIKIEFFTAEQKKAREAEKLRRKKAEAEMRARILENNVLDVCEGYSLEKHTQPIKRVPPRMPMQTDNSGHCLAKYNVDEYGYVSDAITTFCTREIFRESTLISLSKWKYEPKLIGGKPVNQCGLETKIQFELVDEKGNVLPE